MNARRPGSETNTICMLPPDAFEFVVPAPAESPEAAIYDDDPLAGLGFQL